MGCHVSAVEVHDSKEASKDGSFRDVNEGTSGCERRLLNDLQLDCLRSTWPLIAQNRMANGYQIFRKIFYLDPKLKHSFSFR